MSKERRNRAKFQITAQGAVRDELYLVNGVAYIEGDLKLMHLRILLAIIAHLQRAIQYKISHRRRPPDGLLPSEGVLIIPVTSIVIGKKNTSRLRTYLQELCTCPVIFPEQHAFSGLIAGFDFPMYAKTISISLPEDLMGRLLLTEEGYTCVSYTGSTSLTNKYTVRLYWLICAWRNRGGFVISLSDFRRILCLSGSYSRFDNIVSLILAPSEKELESRFPIWFRYRLYDTDGTRKLVFKIHLRISEEERTKALSAAWDYCFNLLSTAGAHLTTIQDIFARLDYEDLRPFMEKIVSITTYLRKRPSGTHSSQTPHSPSSSSTTPASSPIHNPDHYIRTVMDAWFSSWLDRYK